MKRRAILSGLLAGALMLTLAACSGPAPEPTVTRVSRGILVR